MRKSLKITNRISGITNAFVQSIIPTVEPTANERIQALEILGQKNNASKLECVYCGDKASDWDHLRPLVKQKKPSGYINEIRNLVPSCGKCNQSKSGQDWLKWMRSNAKMSPTTRLIKDIDSRIEKLLMFEAWANIKPYNIEECVDKDLWDNYWKTLKKIEELMFEAQNQSIKIRFEIQKSIDNQKS